MKTILVTGGAGFIGSHLAEKLVGRGDVVIGVDNFNRFYSPRQKRANLNQLRQQPLFHGHQVDIRDRRNLEEVFSQYAVDCVVHLAAMAGVRPSIENPILYSDVNVIGTTVVLETMKKFNVKQLVFASSSSVYGNRTTGPFKETDATDAPISPYGATKKAGELLCHTYARLYGIKTTVLRFFTAYGPRNRPDMACFKFVDAIMRGRPIMRFGSGNTGRDYTFVDDIIEGIVAAIDKPFDFEVINLGNSSPVKLTTLIKTIERVVGKKAIINELPLQAGDVELTFADIKKANQLLKYRPRIGLETGMRLLLNWYLTTARR